jgi:hypothetical protein
MYNDDDAGTRLSVVRCSTFPSSPPGRTSSRLHVQCASSQAGYLSAMLMQLSIAILLWCTPSI